MFFFQNRDKTIISKSDPGHDQPRKYLKLWGDDYPYLSENKNKMRRWLPIPENSEAQRFIRNHNTETKKWIMGNGFIMGAINRLGTLPNKQIMR
jgi:hypothetical protein